MDDWIIQHSKEILSKKQKLVDLYKNMTNEGIKGTYATFYLHCKMLVSVSNEDNENIEKIKDSDKLVFVDEKNSYGPKLVGDPFVTIYL